MPFHDSWNAFCREPFGAVKTNCLIKLRVKYENEEQIAKISLRLWLEEKEKIFELSQNNQEKFFEAEFYSPSNGGLIWYYFVCQKINGEKFYYGNNREYLGGHGEEYYEEPPSFQITVTSETEDIPKWYSEGIAYQIFIDRFNRLPRLDISKYREGALIHSNWNDTPFYIKDEQGKIKNWDFFGGNLEGVIEKLPYLREMGISCIYLNPIFEATSNHKYDTGDYFSIDPAFGNEEIFKRLVVEAEKIGMSIILDGVFSHTGSDSIYFNKQGRYRSLGAYQSKESPYYDWYTFTEYPEKYESWWGIEDLPNVDESNETYRNLIFSGEDCVIKKWMDFGVKGWRLDVADELPLDFIRGLRKRIATENKESILIGEVWEDPTKKISYGEMRNYFAGDCLQATMNYPFRELVLDFVLNKITMEMCYRKIMSLYENYPRDNFYAALNLLGSHDVPRILTILGEAPDEETLLESEKEKYKLENSKKLLAIKRLKLLSLLQFSFPGVPCIYYGDEVGMEGFKDPYNRGSFPWGKENQELLMWYRKICKLRKTGSLFTKGDLELVYYRDDVLGYIRKYNNEKALCLFNRNKDSSFKLSFEIKGYDMDKACLSSLFEDRRLKEIEDFLIEPLEAMIIFLRRDRI